MLYNLPDGRTIEISIYDYLELSDDELKDLVSYDIGNHINNPLYGSIITKPSLMKDDSDIFLGHIDICDISSELKIIDQDYDIEEE